MIKLSARLLALLVLLAMLGTPLYAQSNAQYPAGAIPIAASSGNVAAATATATLAATPGRTTYICGFTVTAGGSTAAATVNVTVTNTTGGTLTYNYSTSTGVDAPSAPLPVVFSPCVPANAQNTSIVVSMPTLGSGNAHAAINATGYQLGF
jgi:hypothetical protein